MQHKLHNIAAEVDFSKVLVDKIIHKKLEYLKGEQKQLTETHFDLIPNSSRSVFMHLRTDGRRTSMRTKWKISIILLAIHEVKKLATIVENNLNAPFSVATTLSYKRGHYSLPWITPLYP